MRTWVRGSDRGFSDHNQAGDPVRAGGSVPQGEHGAERVSDHRNPVEPEPLEIGDGSALTVHDFVLRVASATGGAVMVI
jgi:hypothetical protein